MNDFDKKIQEIMKKDIELTENFKNSVMETIETLQKSEISKKQNKTRHRFFKYIKKIIMAILIGASTVTVYATTTKKIDFNRLGLMKLNENYAESIVEMNESIENEYTKITLNSMAGDESYVITEYKVELNDIAINECGEVEYCDSDGYRLWIYANVFVNSTKITNIASNVTKISDKEFVCTQIINRMNFNEENLNIEIDLDSFSINDKNIKLGKVINVEMKLKNKIKNKFDIQEQNIGSNDKIVINGVGNTKFETYIIAQKVTENITYKEFKNRDAYKYNSFIVTNENGEEIPYTIKYSVWAGKNLYIKDENGEFNLSSNGFANDNDIIKNVENFIILIGNQDNIGRVQVIPIETSIFNERTDEELNEYKKVKWYPLIEGENKYSAQSSLGGTFEIEKTEINENDITFYYKTEGLLGNESEIIIRKKMKEMNYIYPTRTEKAGVDGTENKIVFSKEVWRAAGANVWKLDDMFDDISDVEFALMWGSRDKIIADPFNVDIPKQSNNIADFNVIESYEPKKMILECESEIFRGKTEKYEISYDKDNKVLSFDDHLGYVVSYNEEYYKDVTTFVEKIKDYYERHGEVCNIVE